MKITACSLGCLLNMTCLNSHVYNSRMLNLMKPSFLLELYIFQHRLSCDFRYIFQYLIGVLQRPQDLTRIFHIYNDRQHYDGRKPGETQSHPEVAVRSSNLRRRGLQPHWSGERLLGHCASSVPVICVTDHVWVDMYTLVVGVRS